jgi:pimeloyl-ACP methyl ester carboxylesterase
LDIVQYRDVAAGVPYVAVPPEGERPDAPVVVAWHLADPPRTETALAAALPLAGLDAWRIYLGLPMHSSRSIDPAEYLRLAYEDAVVNHFGPITAQACAEFPAAYAALTDRFGFGGGPLAMLGGSLGSAVAQLVALDRDDVVAEVLVSPVTRLRAVVAVNERRFDVTYPWHPKATEIADELDFVARADETTMPVQIIVGDRDDPAIRDAAADLEKALRHVDLVTVPDMPHELADQDERPLPHAATVDGLAVAWLQRHLP